MYSTFLRKRAADCKSGSAPSYFLYYIVILCTLFFGAINGALNSSKDGVSTNTALFIVSVPPTTTLTFGFRVSGFGFGFRVSGSPMRAA